MVILSSKTKEVSILAKKATFIVGKIDSLPIKSNSINKLFNVNTIYFWDDLKLAFIECLCVLKTNGLLAIAIRPKGCMLKYPSLLFNFNYFEISEIEVLFLEYGFELYACTLEIKPVTEFQRVKSYQNMQ